MSVVAGPSRPNGPHIRADHERRASQLYNTVARLSIHDLEELRRSQGLRHTADGGRPLSDAELALHMAVEEAEALNIFNQDRVIANRLQHENEVQPHFIDAAAR